MNALFRNGHLLKVSTEDGRNSVLLEDKEIEVSDGDIVTRYKMPAGASSDGASIPEFLWSLGLPPFGVYWAPAFAHDTAYRGTLLEFHDGDWVPAMLDEAASNELINALMFCTGTDSRVRLAIYTALQKFGFKAFNDDRLAIKQPAPFLPGNLRD